MASSFDPFAANADPFATFAPTVPSSPTVASAPVDPYQQQQQHQHQHQQPSNPFAVYANQSATQPAPVGPNPTHVVNNSMVPVAPHHQQNQWAMQASPSPNASGGGFHPNSQMIPNAYPQSHQPQTHTQQVSPGYAQDQSSMIQSPNPSNSYQYPSSTTGSIPQQQPGPSSNVHTSVPSSPPAAAAPAVITDDDNDFFGDFSNNAPAKSPEAPNRPPSVFEAGQNDDVSYLSRSTNGGLSERQPTNGKSPLDDPKFAPKPRAPEGLANAIALSQEAPASASPLPDFNMITHSGYTLARISFRTILIKKWKQIFWVTYGDSKVLFFRSNSDFEDWISNPYLSQPQRDFLVKLNVDFVGDIGKQSVRGYQVTNQRLKNYNNRMLHQFKLERWMDYGPTIAAAFASPNEREVYNLRTVFTELMKRANQARVSSAKQHMNAVQGQYNATGRDIYGRSPTQNRQPFQYPSSASAGGRYDVGAASSVYSGYSGRSHQSHPGEMRHDSGNEYVGGYRVVTNQRY